ncbi:hypothetical protein Ppb6_03042 [Photorhabdus australis subsp. thailandensis]|uniref:Uncharacterized protein n=1 Tax=Photorhabdus australis subsp. thailandensis TaxID=2805096 RepID=A0A1C0U1V8_9GAMM|nr:hypothetical protein Ppb6_03042 [Photorhabdus australis subsp. thailandensis]
MVDYLYIIFSLLAFYPLYIAFKKLLTPYDVYINFSAVLLMVASNLFHIHVFYTSRIPFLGVSISDNDFMFYSPFVLSWLCTITFMIAHSRHYRKNKW